MVELELVVAVAGRARRVDPHGLPCAFEVDVFPEDAVDVLFVRYCVGPGPSNDAPVRQDERPVRPRRPRHVFVRRTEGPAQRGGEEARRAQDGHACTRGHAQVRALQRVLVDEPARRARTEGALSCGAQFNASTCGAAVAHVEAPLGRVGGVEHGAVKREDVDDLVRRVDREVLPGEHVFSRKVDDAVEAS